MSNFKVGDWVREDFGDMNIVKIKEKYVSVDGNVYINNLNSELFSPWQPKEGEWCWFYNSSIERWFISKWENSSSQLSDLWHKTCEPFVGELPSFLKDNK